MGLTDFWEKQKQRIQTQIKRNIGNAKVAAEKKAYAEKKEKEQKELEKEQMNMPMEFPKQDSKGFDTKKLAVFVGIPIVLVVAMALIIKKKK